MTVTEAGPSTSSATRIRALLSRLKGERTPRQWARALGLSRQAVERWFVADFPSLPGARGYARITQRHPEVAIELLHLTLAHQREQSERKDGHP